MRKTIRAFAVTNLGGRNLIFNSAYYHERLPIFTTRKRAEAEIPILNAADKKANDPTRFARRVIAVEVSYNDA